MKQGKTMFLKMLLCGVLVAVPYVVPSLWFISYITLIPTIYLVITKIGDMTKKRSYLYGLAFGLGYYIVMYHWFLHFYSLKDSEGISPFAAIAVALVCWFGLALVQAIEFGGVMLLYRIIRPNKEKPLICGTLITALWVTFEWQQSLFWRGVPFARLAITQSNSLFTLQSASLLGNLFISALVVFINVLLYVAITEAKKRLDGQGIKAVFKSLKNKKTAILSAVALGIFTANLVFGVIRVATLDAKKGAPIKAAVIQANISSLDKWAGFNESYDTYIEMTKECVAQTGATLVVWPETVLPYEINVYPEIMQDLSELSDTLNINLLVGSFAAMREDGKRHEYNAMYLFYPDGSVSKQRYYKQRLVPFGEYNPIGPLLALVPALDVLGVFNDSLTPGNGSQLLDTEYGKLGALICFDSIYEGIVRSSVNDGATLITLSTNDSWFADSTAVYQHNRHAVLRAIENGRYVVRSASTGVSSFISPTGEILDEIPPLTKGYAACEVYTLEGRTVYSYIGDIFAYLCIGTVIGFISHRITKNIIEKRKNENDSSKS